MIILDENFPESQRQLLEGGVYLSGRLGMKLAEVGCKMKRSSRFYCTAVG